MGKRKLKESVKIEEFADEEEFEEVNAKISKKLSEDKKDIKREEQSGSSFPESNLKSERITFDDASAIIKKNANCGLKIVKEKRHVSLPYHLMSGKINEALEYICKLQLNKYRGNVGGAIIAVNYKGIKLISKSRVIDDQPCFHCQVMTPLVVFSPAKEQNFEATVTSIGEGFITALIYGVITVNMDVNMKKSKTANKLEVGDIISVSCDCLQIKRGMCQMKGVLGKFVRKRTKSEIDAMIMLSAERKSEDTPSKHKKAVRLDESDNDD